MALIDRYVKKKDPLSPSLPQTSGLLIDRYVTPKITVTPEKEVSPIKKVRTGLVKFGVGVGVGAAGLITSTLDFTADLFSSAVARKIKKISPRGEIGEKKGIELAKKWQDFYEKTAGAKTEKLKTLAQDLRKIEILKPSAEWSKASTKEKLSAKRIGETILNIGPDVVASIGAFAINPFLGFALSSGSVADEITTIGKESGLDKEKAEMLGLGTGIVVGFIDKIVPDELFTPQAKKKFIGGVVKRIVKIGLKEAATEIVQEDIQLAVEATLRDDISQEEIIERNVMAGLGGLMGGVGASGMISFANSVRTGEIGGTVEVEEIPARPSKREKITVTQDFKGAEAAFAIIRPDGTAAIDVRLKPKAQGKGLGTKIVSTLESRLEEKGVETVELTAFDESVGFWEKQGYVATGEKDAQGNVRLTKTLEVKAPIKPDVKEGETLASKVDKFKSVDDFVKAKHDISLESLEPFVVREKLKVESKEAKGPVIARVESDGGIIVVSGLNNYFKAVATGQKTVAVQFDQKHTPTIVGLGEVFARAKAEVKKRIVKKPGKPVKDKKKVKPKKPVKEKPSKKEKVVKVPEKQLPVGEGKKKVSRLAARITGKLDAVSDEEIEKLGLATFRQMNKKANKAKAAKYVLENPNEALRVIKGEIDPPKGILTNSVFVVLHELGKTDLKVARDVASLGATRMGQEISILSEIDKDSVVTLMTDLVKVRVEAFEKRTGKKVSDKIKSEIKKVDEAAKPPNGRQWDAFLKEILC